MKTQHLPTLGALEEFAGNLARLWGPGDLVLLDGPMGAGKTAFTQALARHWGVEEPVTSPTYALIQLYEGKFPLVHMDLYRLGSEEEFELIGGPEYFQPPYLCVIEWSQRLPQSYWTSQAWRLVFDYENTGRSVKGTWT